MWINFWLKSDDSGAFDFFGVTKRICENLKDKLILGSAMVYKYKDEFGSDLKKPDTLEQKAILPSDHYPLIFTLENLYE